MSAKQTASLAELMTAEVKAKKGQSLMRWEVEMARLARAAAADIDDMERRLVAHINDYQAAVPATLNLLTVRPCHAW